METLSGITLIKSKWMLISAVLSPTFSVDIFNEGVDVLCLDMILFLRPTESPVVFLQQFGRGLRRCPSKKYLNLLDFIGNYKKANLVPFLLSGEIKQMYKRTMSNQLPDEEEYPDNCIVNFDLRIIDLFKRMAKQKMLIFERIRDEYFRIKEFIGDRSLRIEMYTYIDLELYNLMRVSRENNIFRDYIEFLQKIDELSEDDSMILGTVANDFIRKLENTDMTKTYKIPLLNAFYNDGDIKFVINDEDIYQSFRRIYKDRSNAIDLLRDKSGKGFELWGKKEYLIKAQNPVDEMLHSAGEFFSGDLNNFILNPRLAEYAGNQDFVRHFKDVLAFKLRRFYKERLEKNI